MLRSPALQLVVWVLACFCLRSASGQLLRVDINAANPPRNDTTAPGFTRWDILTDLSSATLNRVAPHVFTNITVVDDVTNISTIGCTVAQTFPDPGVVNPTIYLSANWGNKNGNSTSPDPSVGWRLSADAVWVHEKNDGLSMPSLPPPPDRRSTEAACEPTCSPCRISTAR